MPETKTQNKPEPGAKPPVKRRPRKLKKPAAEAAARANLEAVAARDVEAVLDTYAPAGIEDIVALGVYRGRGELRAMFTELFAAFPDFEVVVDRVVADDQAAFVQWRGSGTFSGGPFQGIEPNGRHVQVRAVDCMEVEDGKIVRNTVYYDGAAFARQVGMLPRQDSGGERAMVAAFNAVTKVRSRLAAR